jgi:hypothetical protein
MNYNCRMAVNTSLSLTGAVCVLLVNRIPVMPKISIGSILATSEQPVYLGFVNPSDVEEFKDNPKIILVDLSEEYRELDLFLDEKSYTGWTNDDFFRIVQLKWSLLNRVLQMDFEFVIYSDLDVIWQLDAYLEVSRSFMARPDISIQIQSFTRNLDDPRLCMGFVAFRNDLNSRNFIQQSSTRHRQELQVDSRVGDDDIATLLYLELEFPTWVHELPQTTFPVGVSLNLFRGKPVFPGLISQEPFIYHANFVVGLRNKILLMKVFLKKEQRQFLRANFTILEMVVLCSKRFRYFVRKWIQR